MLDQILESVGDMESPPPEPADGIPKQLVPGPVRLFLKLLFLPFVWLDLGSQWIARQIIRPPYKKVGKCMRRGNCCYYVLIRKSSRLPAWVDLFWQTHVSGFYRRNRHVHYNQGVPYYVMGCRHLKKDGACGAYRLRPMICRTWPRIDYFGHPQILKGCGFKAASRKGEDPLHILQD